MWRCWRGRAVVVVVVVVVMKLLPMVSVAGAVVVAKRVV